MVRKDQGANVTTGVIDVNSPSTSTADPNPILDDGTLEPGENASSSQAQTQAANNPEPEINPDLLEALGGPACDTSEYGPKIHDSLVDLPPLSILQEGMAVKEKEKLLKEYLIPNNCRSLQSPKLNDEISKIAKVTKFYRGRDNVLMSQQQQLGSGITAVKRAIELFFKKDFKKKDAMYHLGNACRILYDLHAMFTKNRIELMTPCVDKNFLHVIKDSERDETLFGKELSNKIEDEIKLHCAYMSLRHTLENSANSDLQSPSNSSMTRPK
ncbi:hypothetical protein NE865_07853 [Phthorimaea operculella]|nr:hypothetical protein NE865_07853 [Phthorimaea operculella]